MKRPLVTLTLVSALLAGCATTVVEPYKPSMSATDALTALQVPPFAVDAFTARTPGRSDGGCRVGGSVTVKPSFEGYVEKAFVDELKQAALYDPTSPRRIRGTLGDVDFNASMLRGKWVLSLSLENQRKERLEVSATYEVGGGYLTELSCEESARQFAPAVRKLIGEAIANPGFKRLVQ